MIQPGQTASPKAKLRARPAAPRSRTRENVALSAALDEKLIALQREGQVGFVLPVGEWAGVLAVAAAAPAPQELIFPSLRESRVALFRGLPLADLFRQALGLDLSTTESQAGHALPGFLADQARRVASPGGSLGAHLPQAVGAGLAARLSRRAEAVLALAGIAATDGDDCHTALNFAAVLRAPVVFLIRGDPAWARGEVVQRAKGYAVPAVLVEGDDLEQLEARLATLLVAAREGKGPAVIEVTPPKSPELDRSALDAAARECEAALAVAKASAYPALRSLVEGVHLEPNWAQLSQLRELEGRPAVPPEEV